MFNASVNTTCIHRLFSGDTISRMKAKKMHAQMARLYEAAREAGRLTGEGDQTGMARLLNVPPQNVNNWEARGPSKECLLQAQLTFGVNAAWAITGDGPMFVGGSAPPAASAWPFRRIDIRRLERLDDTELAFIEGKLESAIEAAEGRVGAAKRAATG